MQSTPTRKHVLQSHLQQLQAEAQLDSVERVVWHNKAIVHEQKIIAEAAIAQHERLIGCNLLQSDQLQVPIRQGLEGTVGLEAVVAHVNEWQHSCWLRRACNPKGARGHNCHCPACIRQMMNTRDNTVQTAKCGSWAHVSKADLSR